MKGRRRRRLQAANFGTDRHGGQWHYRLHGSWLDELGRYYETGMLFPIWRGRR